MKLDMTRWSSSQRAAIVARGENVLVSAGAGSGKTSVLVERVVSCLCQEPVVDLTRLLVVTFTEAAAAEMRNRIAKRLHHLAEQAMVQGEVVEARHLSNQIALLDQAQVSTLHSFCMRVVRKNFLYLRIEPRFRLLEDSEALLLRTEILQTLVEERLRASEAEDFRAMMTQFRLRDPGRMSRLVFRVDQFSMSQVEPSHWLQQVVRAYGQAGQQEFSDLPWTQDFLTYIRRSIRDAKERLLSALQLALAHEELAKYAENLTHMLESIDLAESDVEALNLEQAGASLTTAIGLRLAKAKEHPLRETVKKKRDQARAKLSVIAKILQRGKAGFVDDITRLTPTIEQLVNLVVDFQARYQEEKQQRGVLDFHDLEHYAYRVLTDPESGEADRLREQFAEVFVDEYQDTSPIQDAIVHSIARAEGNVFTVGDVKQSIYRFRMAEPKLFLHQYESLGKTEPGQVIHLVENYRSRFAVVEAVNFFFQQFFTEKFGGLRYDEETRMRAGAQYPEQEGIADFAGPVEFHWVSSEGMDADSADSFEPVDLANPANPAAFDKPGKPAYPVNPAYPARALGDSGGQDWSVHENGYGATEYDPNALEESGSESADAGAGAGEPAEVPGWDEDSEDLREFVDAEREALVVAQRIGEWMGHENDPASVRRQVWDPSAQAYRPLQYRDIVILMRSAKGRMNRFLEVLEGFSIPAYGVTSSGFYGSVEVRWLLSALSAIDNPRREIDLVALLRSPLAGFVDAELAAIRTIAKGNFWDAFTRLERTREMAELPAVGAVRWTELRRKVRAFVQDFTRWRTLSRRSGAEEVARALVQDTNLLYYVATMPLGQTRKANVELFLDSARAFDKGSLEGVFGFVAEAQKRLSHNVDVGEGRTLGENEDVVRLMTIHQSKGLEFPVVFVVGMGKMFHLGADEQAFQLHRELGFGPQRIDPLSHRRWWTLPAFAIKEAELSESLAEEARILYVALTRARERLVLVGSTKQMATDLEKQWDRVPVAGVELPYNTLMSARTYLDWLLPALLRHPSSQTWRTLAQGDNPDVRNIGDVRKNGDVRNIGGLSLSKASSLLPTEADFLLVSWNCPGGHSLPAYPEALSGHRGTSMDEWDAATVREKLAKYERTEDGPDTVDQGEAVLASLEWSQPATILAVPGKISATDLRRLWVAGLEADQPQKRSRSRASAEGLLEDPDFVDPKLSGRMSGIAFHAVMQHLNLTLSARAESVTQELERLKRDNLITEDQSKAVIVNEIVAFLASPLGQRVAAGKKIWREQPFFYRLAVSEQQGSGDFVLVQGVMDCLVQEERGWLILDYKTDQVRPQDVESKTAEYHAQVAAYHEVVQSLGSGLPVESFIYFVKPGISVQMPTVDLTRVFRHAKS